MGIVLGSNFDLQTALPLDSRTVVADLTARDAINALVRYEGLPVYVVSEGKTFRLVGGITNGDWQEDGGGGSVGPLENSGTGVISGLGLNVNANPAQFDIAVGEYEVLDTTNPAAPVLTKVSYAGSTGNTVTNLASQDVTYILLDSAGAITQQGSYPTPAQRRGKAFIGRLNHSNRTSISFTNTFPDFKLNLMNQFYDLLDALAPFKISGLNISANGANLSFNRAAGSTFFRSENYLTDNQNPHYKTFTSQTLQPFRKLTQSQTVDVVDVTVVDPANYDNAGTVTAIPGGSNTSTIQRVYLFKSGAVRVAYGQATYGSLTAAVQALGSDPFVPNATIEASAILIGYIIATKACTSLQDTSNCKIVQAARFDAFTGNAGADTYGGNVTVNNTLAGSFNLSIDTTVKAQTVVVSGASGPVDSSLAPFGGVPPLDGAEITLIGGSDTNTVTILSNPGGLDGVYGYDVTLHLGESVTYKYISALTGYVIKSKSN